MSKTIGKNKSKNLSDSYSSGIIAALHQRVDHAKQSGPDALKTGSKRAIQKEQKQLVTWFLNLIQNKDSKLLMT